MDLVHYSTQKGGDCMSQYVKVGRLIAGDDGWVRLMKDGSGEIGRIHQSDILFTLAGMGPVERLELSNSGKSIQVMAQGSWYVILAKQVRGMIRDWPKKRAALWRGCRCPFFQIIYIVLRRFRKRWTKRNYIKTRI